MADNEVLTLITAKDQTAAGLQGAGNSVKEYAKNTESAGQQVEKSHLSMRHAMGMLASQSGMSTRELMHFYYAVQMVPGPLGIALGAVMALKSAVQSYSESQKKAAEEQAKFVKGTEGAYAFTRGGALTGAAATGAKEIENLNDKRDAMVEKVHELGDSLKGYLGIHNDEIRVLTQQWEINQALTLDVQKRTILEAQIADSLRKQAEFSFSQQMAVAVTENAAKDKKLEQDEQIARLLIRAELENEASEKAKGTPGEEEHRKASQSAALEAKTLEDARQRAYEDQKREYDKRMTAGAGILGAVDPNDKRAVMEKSFAEQKIKDKAKLADDLEAIDKNVYLSGGQRDDEKFMVRKAAAAKGEQDELNHLQAIDDLNEASARFIADKDRAVLDGRGEHYKAQLAALETEHAHERAAHRKNADELTAIDAAYTSRRESLQREHLNKELAFTLNTTSELLTLKGRQYDAKRVQLEAWYAKELEANRGQADKLAALETLKGAKLAELNRKQSEERHDTAFKYQAQIVGATQGNKMAELLTMREETRKAVEDLERRGEYENADLARKALGAREGQMLKDTRRELAGAQRVSFTDAASGWSSFASSLNSDPTKREQLGYARSTVKVLEDILGETKRGQVARWG